MILADENIDFLIIENLRREGFTVVSIAESFSGLSDYKIIGKARELNATIITKDKDFGEWVFARFERRLSIIFLRYYTFEVNVISEILVRFLLENKAKLENKFITITTQKIRVREI